MQSIPKQPGVLGIDVGTSGMKMAFYDFEGNEILSTREEYPTYYPYPGWIEQSPEDWWNAVIHGLDTFWKRNLNPQQIVAIGLSGQMENCLLLDQSGNPLHRVLLYSDSRATVEADLISRRIGKKRIQQIFGNRIDHATTVAKLLWIKRHHPEWYHLAKTVVSGAKDFIIFRFTNQYVTDPTNASTTGSMNILSRQWEKAIIEDIGLSSSLFPPIVPATEQVGVVSQDASMQTGITAGCPVFCGLGDAGASQLGSGVVGSDRSHCYLGTTGWVATVKSEYSIPQSEGLFVLSGPDLYQYLYIAPLLNAGRAYDWILRVIIGEKKRKYHEMEHLLSTIPYGSNGLFFLPYLVGERCPYRDSNATGVFFGLTDQTTDLDMIRATLEGVAFGVRQALEITMDPTKIKEMVVTGGGSQSKVWSQIIADVCGCKVTVPTGSSVGPCFGAALCALVGMKIKRGFSDIEPLWTQGRQFYPHEKNREIYKNLFQFYAKLYPTLKPLFKKKKIGDSR
ncbi:MAG: xylulokinase [Atribacter sp.]|jgi:xylulokinase|uniref:xylulokinase n=1 Tax=Atribacter sp. TaxID=2847780 RepID=UPI003D97885B